MRTRCASLEPLALGAAMLLAPSACASDASIGAASRRDSAGVEIVESIRPRWTGEAAWRVADEPLVSIGTALDGDPATQFTSIGGVLRLADGRIVVADRTTAELRFFDSTGAHLRTVGRKGSGPGELPSIDGILRLPGDTLLVGARMPPREALFAGTGEFVRVNALPRLPGAARPASTQHVLEDGTRIVTEGGFRILGPSTGSRTDSLVLHAVARGAEAPARIGAFPSMRLSGEGQTTAAVAYSPRIVMANGRSTLYVGFPERFEIDAYAADGRMRRSIRRAWELIPVDAAARERYLARYTAPDAPPSFREIAKATTFAETHPAYDQLLTDADGNVWARVITRELVDAGPYPTDRAVRGFRWSVFDSSGAWLGDLETPASFGPTDIGRDRIAGVWQDEDGVSYVRVYRLVKP